jgi:hypothetical protein
VVASGLDTERVIGDVLEYASNLNSIIGSSRRD